ncbi:GNAT family N-acetyltransferase [Ornithinibacillus contaminans]|uniref:GNAT family N-acetyltransferase n=1 Tax=Ornithinibacillus contaminans TaxID=694055 RepID=UPI00064E099A|nr:GNAT family N-acetyltransferase [Ornithinibacillus contaminans]
MNWTTTNITQKYAVDILSWKYDEPYDFYNNVLSGEAILELTRDAYRVIIDANHDVIGFYCTGNTAQVPAGNRIGAYQDDCIDIGFGMRPDLTGKGLGKNFLQLVLQNIELEYDGSIRLTVADFNKRAIQLYKRFNFRKKDEFYREDVKFITMLRTSEGR